MLYIVVILPDGNNSFSLFGSSAFDRNREAWTSEGRFSQCGSWPRASLLVEVRPPEWCVNYSVNYNKLYITSMITHRITHI